MSVDRSGPLRIEVEDDPTPIVLILAATLRRSARQPKLAAAMAKAKGNVAMKSSVDPQAATIRFARGTITVVRGVASDAHVIIEADVNKMADENPPKPKVSGIAGHVRLALLASKVLEPPNAGWRNEATAFFAPTFANPKAPRGVSVTCLNDASTQTFGDPDTIEYEIHGTEHALLNVFCGNTVLGQDLLDGKIRAVGSLPHLAELTGRSIAVMLGA